MNEREICERLVWILDAMENKTVLISNQGQALDGYSALAEFVAVAKKARLLIPNYFDEVEKCPK